jgi:hypothetical protein
MVWYSCLVLRPRTNRNGGRFEHVELENLPKVGHDTYFVVLRLRWRSPVLGVTQNAAKLVGRERRSVPRLSHALDR